MRLTRALQGLVWAWRVGRVNRGHHLTLSIVSGICVFLFLFSLTSSPDPAALIHRPLNHGAARRIQQQPDDYTGPKNTNNRAPDITMVRDGVQIIGENVKDGIQKSADKPQDSIKFTNGHANFIYPQIVEDKVLENYKEHPISENEKLIYSGNRRVRISIPEGVTVRTEANIVNLPRTQNTSKDPFNLPVLSQPQSSTKQGDTGIGEFQRIFQNFQKAGTTLDIAPVQGLVTPVGLKPYKDVRESLSQLGHDIPRTSNQKIQIISAQERALAAIQHGYKITEQQKTLLSRLSPASKKALETKSLETRKKQDLAYMNHLRSKHQILPRKGGGEEIYSNSRMNVRFPVTLKTLPPSQWPPQYHIFANLTHHPWMRSDGCNNYTTTFYPPDSHATRALASFPSSGNTWVRYLIEGATGKFTGSLYDDTSLTRRGLYGEGVIYSSGMTVVQKSHGYTTGEDMNLSHQQRLDKNHLDELSRQGVIVIRNPFKALISHRHLDVGGHTGYAPKAHFIGKGWASFVTLKIQLWRDFYMDWITRTDPPKIHVTHYENLKTDPINEMRKTLTYLGIKIDPRRLSCVEKNMDGSFKRKPSKNMPLDFNPFTKELKDLVYEAIEQVNQALGHAGKEVLPLDKYEIYDPKEAKIAKYLKNQGA